jgi:pyruvate dehydrogenase E1 component alpha subunit
MAFAKGAREDFPISVPVASHAPHAVGVAYAFKYRRQSRVCLCVVGDGATSKGDFYEAINAAGVWDLPVVFVVNNNQWAISVPRSQQSKSQTLAQKAIAAGFDAEQVDGNDVIAMKDRLDHALDKARNTGGPHLIEALTYRLCDHTTADDASRYRDPEELKQQQQKDPIKRLRTYLHNNDYINDDLELRMKTECVNQVEEEINRYLNTAPLEPRCMFDHLYESLPEAFAEQREMMAKGDVNDA